MADVRITEEEWKDARTALRSYRDKFIAHLDSEHTMHVPQMDIPERMVRFYYAQLRFSCSSAAVLLDRPADMENYYIECYEEAIKVYRRNKAIQAAGEDARGDGQRFK